MHIALVGVNHQTAPVGIREKMAIGGERLPDALSLLREHISQGLILSTCNRTEIYSISNDGAFAAEANLGFLKSRLNGHAAELDKHVYVLKDEVAVEHLFHLASGLDSMILGEYEILGQVGNAFEIAEKAGMVELPLRYIFQSAIRTGRRVREETGISRNAMSVSSVAVDLAAKTVGDLNACRMLIVGVGEAGRLVAKAARERGTSNIVVVNRTMSTAETFAATLGARAASLFGLGDELSDCNLVVACANAPHYLLDREDVRTAMKSRPEKPLVIVDIGVPRNVDPAVCEIENVFLYNIDDLTQISQSHRKQRESEVEMAKAIVASEMDKFSEWRKTLSVSPVVRALMQKAEDVRAAQLEKTLKKLPQLSDEERESLESMTKSIVTKILKDPIDYLKSNKENNQEYVEALNELFRLKTVKHA